MGPLLTYSFLGYSDRVAVYFSVQWAGVSLAKRPSAVKEQMPRSFPYRPGETRGCRLHKIPLTKRDEFGLSRRHACNRCHRP